MKHTALCCWITQTLTTALHTRQGGREVRYLQRAALLDPAEAPGVGDEVVATAAALLSAARRSAQSAGSHASADAAGVWSLLVLTASEDALDSRAE